MQNETYHDSFSALVEKAEATRQELQTVSPQEALKKITAIVESNDIVFGIWPDADAPEGVGKYIIKGVGILQSIIDRGESEFRTVAAIPCINYEQAVAASQVMGDARAAH